MTRRLGNALQTCRGTAASLQFLKNIKETAISILSTVE